jgi:hypothetical protein
MRDYSIVFGPNISSKAFSIIRLASLSVNMGSPFSNVSSYVRQAFAGDFVGFENSSNSSANALSGVSSELPSVDCITENLE